MRNESDLPEVTTAFSRSRPSTKDFAAQLKAGDSLGKYVLEELVGEGSFAYVFAARHSRLNQKRALKVLKPEFIHNHEYLTRFIRDAQAAVTLDHPHIVRVYDVDEHPIPYIVMEYINGNTLHEQMARRQLNDADILQIGIEIASALAAAHAAHIVHRDVKPANILIDHVSGQAKLADFNVAHQPRAEEIAFTLPGTPIGTPRYMAPEQWRGQEVDGRADLFSLGITLYEASTGINPFPGRTAEEVRYSIENQDPQPLSKLRPSLPDALSSLIMELLRKSIDQRPKNAEIVCNTLVAIRMSLQQKKISRSISTQKWSRRHIAMVVGLFSGLGAFMLYANIIGPHPPPEYSWEGSSTGPKAERFGLVGSATQPMLPPSFLEAYQTLASFSKQMPTSSAFRGALADYNDFRRRKDASYEEHMLGEEQWMLVQQGLVALGFDPGPIDGNPGARTMEAFYAWRESQQRDLSGPISLGEFYELFRRAYFEDAADRVRTGRADAYDLHEIGIMYLFAQGTSENLARGVESIRLAANTIPEASNDLGILYFYGLGVEKNYAEAFYLFRSAADAGNWEARRNLARMTYLGRGVAQDVPGALYLLIELSNDYSGDYEEDIEDEIIDLLYRHGEKYKFERAIKLLEEYAESGHDTAAYVLGRMHKNGLGMAIDLRNALLYFRMSADSYVDAAYEIARMHIDKEGGSREDFEVGVNYLQGRALNHGDDEAKSRLTRRGIDWTAPRG